MSKSEDVQTLFRRFGGNASTYQEVVSRDQVTQAEAKWPILGMINPTANQEAPSVRRPSVPATMRQNQPPSPAPGSALAAGGRAAGPAASLAGQPVSPATAATGQSSGLFGGLLPPKAARPASSAVFRPLAQSAPAPVAASVQASPTAESVRGLSTGMLNRFKAANSQPLAAGAASAPILAPAADSVPSGRLFASLVPPATEGRPLSGALSHQPSRSVPAEAKVVHGSELQALFGRMAEPPAPAAAPKKEAKSSKRAIKW